MGKMNALGRAAMAVFLHNMWVLREWQRKSDLDYLWSCAERWGRT
jgi:hypothetical protein